MATQKILISDPVDSVCAEILKKNGFQVDQIKMTKDELLAAIKNYDGLIVRSETKVTADIFEKATNLKIVGRAGTGVDNVDCGTATKRGVLVMNTPGGNTLSAAEHTCALIASMARHIPQGCASLKNGAWDRKIYMGSELYGKTLAIIGLGKIGKEVALRMQSYGMTTIGYDPIIPGEVSREFGVEWMELEKIWPIADYITVHTPLIPQTKNLINDNVFKKCKKGVKLINVARGGIIEEESVLRNLKNGLCGGAALDVFCEEPPKSEYYKELFAHPLVVCTPHLGASTTEAQTRVAEEIAEQFVQFFNGTGLVGAVNASSLASAMSSMSSKPWLTLSRALGVFTSILGNATKLDINVECNDLKDVSFISSAVAAGYLSGLTRDSSINMINSTNLAKEKGIELKVTKSDSSDKVLRISAQIGSNVFKIVGGLHGEVPVLRSFDDNKFEYGLPLTGHIVFFNGATNGFTPIEGAFGKKNFEATSIFKSQSGKTIWYAANISGAGVVTENDLSGLTGVKFVADRLF